jgi:hypothetical protein
MRLAEEVPVIRLQLTCGVLLTLAVGCGGLTQTVRLPEKPPGPEEMAQLWIDPANEPRDTFWGAGGQKYAPDKDAKYKFEQVDELGFSVSYDVEGPDGVEWSAKIGPEAQTEVVLSRVLWGLGYHQPPIYYLPSWTLVTDDKGTVKKESEARFRPKLDNLERLEEYWSWSDNPYIGTAPFNGLLVVLLMFNSTDLKDDNNSIYELKQPLPGLPTVKKWFVVRDLGAALGETGKLYPRRNWIEGFEEQGFLKGVKDGRIEFDYTGRHRELLRMIRPEDMRWAATRLQKLTEKQWNDASRAANYTDDIRDRYLRKIRQKIEEALKVATTAQAIPDV